MRLLVAGGSEVDAGKTTFTEGLVERTGVRGFKPRAGNGYWYDHDDYRRAVETGRLYGKDAKRLADASPGDVRPEAILLDWAIPWMLDNSEAFVFAEPDADEEPGYYGLR